MLAFFVIWIPATWIFEPSTNLNQEDELKTWPSIAGHAPSCRSPRRTSWASGASAATVPS